MADVEGKDVVLNITTVNDDSWQKPNSSQVYWTVFAQEQPGQIKFIQDTTRSERPTPGEYHGKMWGDKFYPTLPNSGTSGSGFSRGGGASRAKADAEKQGDIKAEWAIGKAIANIGLGELDKVEAMAKLLYAMVDRVKGSSESADPKSPAGATKISPVASASKTGAAKTATNSSDVDAEALSLYASVATSEVH